MNAKKLLAYFAGSMLIIQSLACANTAAQPTAAPTEESTPVPVATEAPSGHITGTAHLQAPPTPKLVVYAVDPATGLWASTEAGPADGEAPFDLVVPPGSYQVFAAVADAAGVDLGYSEDGLTLSTVVVTAGQTISGINVRPPGQSECGSMMGYPASPDGRFAATDGPSPECLAGLLTPLPSGGAYVPVTPEVCGTIQELASQAISLSFSMETDAPFTDDLTGETGRGCTLTAMATGLQFSDPFSVVRTLVDGMLGWEEKPGYQADGPTGSATAMTRDMGLMLILVEWTPAPEVQCPADQPIGACDLKPEQKLYTVQIRTAMK